MGFYIKASYSTGDSFKNWDEVTGLAPVWQNLDKAKQALRWLTEHHKEYEVRNNRWSPGVKRDVTAEPWYVSTPKGHGSAFWEGWWELCVNLELDDGTMMNVSIPYHGYFEHLESLEIVPIEDDYSDMKSTF
jgi:hypothetical protein